MSEPKKEPPTGLQYTPTIIQQWAYYRSADNKNVCHVVHVDDTPGNEQLVIHKWGELKPKYVDYHKFVENIKAGKLKPFRPDPIQYLFGYNIANQSNNIG